MPQTLTVKGLQVAEIVELLDGVVEGSTDVTVMGVSKIDQPSPGTLSFLANQKYEAHLYTASLGAVLVSHDFQAKQAVDFPLIRVEDPYLAFCKVLNTYFNPSVAKQGIDRAAIVHETAQVAEQCYIGPGAVIGQGVVIGAGSRIYPGVVLEDGVKLGEDTVLYPNVTVYYDCEIGNRVIVHAGTTIGCDGFGHAPLPDGTYQKIPQIGNVVIGDDVEIGANCSIDRATMGSTVIENGVRLDNLIQIAHNVVIKANTVIAAQTGISGSTTIEANCVIGGQVGFAGHIHVAPSSTIGAQSGVTKSIKDAGLTWYGTPVQLFKDELRSQSVYKNLTALKQDIEALKSKDATQ